MTVLIQRGEAVLSTGVPSITLNAGTEYLAPVALDRAFFRIVGCWHTAIGDDAGTAAQAPAHHTVVHANPANLLTRVELERYASNFDTRVAWELIECLIPAGDADGWTVRTADVLSFGNGVTSQTGNLANAADASKVAVLLTSKRQNDLGAFNAASGFFTTDFASDRGSAERALASGSAQASIAVIEFTGASWRPVQRIEQAINATPKDAALPTPVLDLGKAFLHVGARMTSSNSDQVGVIAWLRDLNTLRFEVNTVASQTGVAWVIEHTDSMRVQPLVDTLAASETLKSSTITVIDNVAQSSVEGFCGTAAASTGPPEGNTQALIESRTSVQLRSSTAAGTRSVRANIVQWPGAEPAGGPAIPPRTQSLGFGRQRVSEI